MIVFSISFPIILFFSFSFFFCSIDSVEKVFSRTEDLTGAGMASVQVQGASALSFRNGCRCVADPEVTVEDILQIIGEKVGFENIVSASRMNKAVVVFLKSESLINELTVSGIWVKEAFVPITPLSAPATKVTISNVPPFVSNEAILKELQRFGKIASPVKGIPLGCKNAALKHVLSFRRQVYMFLNSTERTLEASFRIIHEESSFIIYASTESMRCYGCGDFGHKRFLCPQKNEQRASSSQAETSNADTLRVQGTDEMTGQQEVSELEVNITGNVEKPGCSTDSNADGSNAKCDESKAQSDTEVVCEGGTEQESGSKESFDDEMEGLSQCTDDGLREDDEQWSEVVKKANKDLYTLDQINAFLDKTKGKIGVEISD